MGFKLIHVAEMSASSVLRQLAKHINNQSNQVDLVRRFGLGSNVNVQVLEADHPGL